MTKPELQNFEHYNYRDCVKYISEKLGYDIDDILGKFRTDDKGEYTDPGNDREFRSYWHFLTDLNEIHNGCFIYLPDEDQGEPWQQEITKAFNEEFGDEEQYWVCW
jgi:hypothetical protein